ncbi:hypothetical protein [Paenibacillus hamazuiensis]|uniref:hypothetical protein n=1 Tax=Paenibacillus hamazuiensis TaxID=2936508 RepID=UPI00200FF107|nr:hypothetical protein [Paenibacillus hamazuiensis]
MNRKAALVALILSQIVYVLFIAVWLFISGMSVMMFDSPEAAGDVQTWLIFIFILLYPLAFLVSLVLGWVFFSRRKYKAALIWNGIPLIWIASLGGFLMYANFS